jgi:hypothetical protein
MITAKKWRHSFAQDGSAGYPRHLHPVRYGGQGMDYPALGLACRIEFVTAPCG